MTDKELAITELQQWLRNIMKNQSDEPAIIPDGIFSEETRRAVEDFQREKGLEVTGVVDFYTWEEIKLEDARVTAERLLPRQVAPIKNSDLPLQSGMKNKFVDVLILMLNHVAEKYENFEFVAEEDFGASTEREIKKWQSVAFLPETGVVDKQTWNSLSTFYLMIE